MSALDAMGLAVIPVFAGVAYLRMRANRRAAEIEAAMRRHPAGKAKR